MANIFLNWKLEYFSGIKLFSRLGYALIWQDYLLTLDMRPTQFLPVLIALYFTPLRTINLNGSTGRTLSILHTKLEFNPFILISLQYKNRDKKERQKIKWTSMNASSITQTFCSTRAIWISKPPPTHTLKCNILKYNTSSDIAFIVIRFIANYEVFWYRKQNYIGTFLL